MTTVTGTVAQYDKLIEINGSVANHVSTQHSDSDISQPEPVVTNNSIKMESEPLESECNILQVKSEAEPEEAEGPQIDIAVNNVVGVFNTKCHLDLKRIAMESTNVEHKRESGMVLMKIRKPSSTATIWSSGKVICTGSSSEEDAKIAARKFTRRLQKIGFKVRFTNFRVVNVLATCIMPFAIRINNFSKHNPKMASYEPEIHPAVTYRIKDPKATLKIFSTGSITVTAPCVANIQLAIEHIFPEIYPYKMDKRPSNNQQQPMEKTSPHQLSTDNHIKKPKRRKHNHGDKDTGNRGDTDTDTSDSGDDTSDDNDDSDRSWD